MKIEWWQLFVIGAILAWGMYVPTIHEGQSSIGGGRPSTGAIRAFLCVGIAYFLTAVIIPLGLLFGNMAGGEPMSFTGPEGVFNTKGVTIATIAGVLGAAGALCIVLSIKNGGKPLYIAPLVFAGAPIVNAIISLIWHPPHGATDPKVLPGWIMFFLGIILAAAGAGLVLYSKGYIDIESKKAQVSHDAPAVAQEEKPPETSIQSET